MDGRTPLERAPVPFQRVNVDAINEFTVREALRSVRYSTGFGGNPLVGTAIVTAELTREELDDTAKSRHWALRRLLERVVSEHVAESRGGALPMPSTLETEIDALRSDFQSGDPSRQAWGMLRFRYLATDRVLMSDVAWRVGAVGKTLTRRLERGHKELAQVLSTMELQLQAREPGRGGSATVVGPPTGAAGLAEASPASGLPEPVDSFIGRCRELGEVAALIARHRLVTLTGTGGIGKTRLALELARGVVGEYAGGVRLARLDRVGSADGVLAAVADALDLPDNVDRASVADIAAQLPDQRSLLLLDNCEHVLGHVAALVDQLLSSGRRLSVLATSREALGLHAETVFQVPPLELPTADALPLAEAVRSDAMRLFADRARRVRQDLTLTEDNAPLVAQLCRRLDGLPLAIELAAARMAGLPLVEIVRRLDDGYRFLRSSDPSRPARQQSLVAALDWSYSLLDDEERLVYGRLAVFAGGFTLEAAEAVCDDPPRGIDEWDVMELVASLVNKSLVEAPPAGQASPRYGMLRVLREYGLARLGSSGEGGAACAKHAAYYLRMVEEAQTARHGGDQAGSLDRLAQEHDNLVEAISWATSAEPAVALRICGALGDYWQRRGLWSTGRRLLEAALAAAGSEPSDARLTALAAAGTLARLQCDFPAAVGHLGQVLEIQQAVGDRDGAAQTLRELGSVAEERGDYDEAARLYSESLESCRSAGDRWGTAAALNNLGILEDHRGRPAAARPLLEESLALFGDLGEQWAVNVVLGNLANVLYAEGALDLAAARYADSLAGARSLDDRIGIADNLVKLAFLAHLRGDERGARRSLAESWPILADLGDKQKAAEWLECRAAVEHASKDDDRAAQLLGAAARLRDAIGSPILPKEQADYQALRASISEALGKDRWQSAFEHGRLRGWPALLAWADTGLQRGRKGSRPASRE